MVGRPVLRAEEDFIGDIPIKDIMVGDEAAAARQALEISYPIDNGVVNNWQDMEHLWNYTFHDKLKVETKGKNILLTEAPLNRKENRSKMVQTMFEKYEFENVHVSVQAMLTLYAQGKIDKWDQKKQSYKGQHVFLFVCLYDNQV